MLPDGAGSKAQLSFNCYTVDSKAACFVPLNCLTSFTLVAKSCPGNFARIYPGSKNLLLGDRQAERTDFISKDKRAND